MNLDKYTPDKRRIIKLYNERLAKHGYTVRGLASGTRGRQFLRFKMVCEVGDLNGKSVLDMGCGFGALLDFFKQEGIQVKEYVGWDINPKIVEIARQRFPEYTFECVDILNSRNPRKFDFVLSSSAFNNILENCDNYEFVREVLKRCYSISNEGVAINFQSDYVDFRRGRVFYYTPERIFSICKAITKRVALRHDFPLYDFAVYLYKNFKPWGKNETN